MTKYVRETAAAKAISAYVIMKGGRKVATVQAHFSNGGRCLVNIWQESAAAEKSQAAADKAGMKYACPEYGNPFGFQHGTASGYGYDKFTAALSSMIIDGHILSNHCGMNRKPGKGKLFPHDYKPAKGWRLSNWSTIDASTGQRVDSYHWRNLAWQELGENAEPAAVQQRAMDLEAAADTISGYADCFRESGLDYLKAIGYQVIGVI